MCQGMRETTINDWTSKFIVTALHQTQSLDMITKSIKSIEIWESLQFKTQALRVKSQEPRTKSPVP